jgi:hypothetical protein
LEKKVFGKPFPSLSVQQRVNRLRKTIGTASSDDLAEGMSGLPGNMHEFGSLPRQFPRGMLSNSPFPDQLLPPATSDPDVNRQMHEMFGRLNQQLRQLHPRGYSQSIPRQFFTPDGGGYDFSDGLPPVPQERTPTVKPSLPPYMDSNSI